MKLLLLIFLFQSPQVGEPEQLVSNFYTWYVNGGYKQMRPTFTELENGFTTMDFSKYDDLHRKFRFSEQLIADSKKIYEPCLSNLETVRYTDFQQFEDIDQLDEINCDFQFNMWFDAGMEPFEHFKLTGTKKVNNKKYEVTIGLAYRTGEQLTRLIPVTVELINSKWLITNIETE